jgi:hypothetical protein
MMFGNPLLPVLGKLNAAFGGASPTVGHEELARFAPGEELGPALASILGGDDGDLNALLAAYVGTMPPSFREALRAVIYSALDRSTQALLNFSWAPAYDFELTIWEIVEPPPHASGVHILIRGRYPDHDERFGGPAAD